MSDEDFSSYKTEPQHDRAADPVRNTNVKGKNDRTRIKELPEEERQGKRNWTGEEVDQGDWL